MFLLRNPSKILKNQTKTILNKFHREDRNRYAKECLKKGNFWHNVCFVDEKRFNLDRPDGCHSYWHDLCDNYNFLSRRQFGGGSIMLWMAISVKGTVSMKLVDWDLSSANYQTMLEENLIPSVKQKCRKNWILLPVS